MKKLKSLCLVLLGVLLQAAACSSNSQNVHTEEIQLMDSVSNDLEKTTTELQDETSNLEAALEKVDKELSSE